MQWNGRTRLSASLCAWKEVSHSKYGLAQFTSFVFNSKIVVKKPLQCPNRRVMHYFALKTGVQLAGFLAEHSRFVPDFPYMISR